MLIEPGHLNVSFGDLQASMKGLHSLGSTLCVEGAGEDLAGDTIQKILSHPTA